MTKPDPAHYLYTVCELAAELVAAGELKAAVIVLDQRHALGLHLTDEDLAELDEGDTSPASSAELEAPPAAPPRKRAKKGAKRKTKKPPSSDAGDDQGADHFVDRVYAAVRDEGSPVGTSFLLEFLELAATSKVRHRVASALCALAESGRLRRVSRGLYEAA